ncbi:MAG: hypothetical protein KatS3mg076_1225 [Candidatus Binatia bacterium]|nr:MAG: hypothetical protein KatS3mg076_1225 [Candidatus Binatia bacterium]
MDAGGRVKARSPWRRAAVLAGSFLLVGVSLLYAFREPLLEASGRFLVVQDEVRPADAIVVLAGSFPDRILHAADLYERGVAPRIVLTVGPEPPGSAELRRRKLKVTEQHERNRLLARRLGVPPEAIVVVRERAGSTIAESRALVRELGRMGIRRVVLVTSKTHSRRARDIFRFVTREQGIEVLVSPTPYDPFSPRGWWRKRVLARRVVTEYGKWLFFELVDRWREGA